MPKIAIGNKFFSSKKPLYSPRPLRLCVPKIAAFLYLLSLPAHVYTSGIWNISDNAFCVQNKI
jgi:hypothetical protein